MICWKLLNSFESRETSWKVGQASCSCNCSCKWQASSSRRADISFNDDNALAKCTYTLLQKVSYHQKKKNNLNKYKVCFYACNLVFSCQYLTRFWAFQHDLLLLGYKHLRKRVYFVMILHLQLAIYTVLQNISFYQSNWI